MTRTRPHELLAEAGWDESRVLKFCVPSADTNRQRTAVIIQQFLADVGIQTEITTLDNATLFSSIPESGKILLANPAALDKRHSNARGIQRGRRRE